MNKAGRAKGIQAALTSAVFLGLAPIFGKQAILQGFTPFAVVFLRTGIAFLLLLFVMIIFWRNYFYIYPLGLIGCILAGITNGLGSIFYYVGLSRVNASIGQLVYSFYPLFVALWLVLDRQAIRKITIFRLGLALPGIVLLVSADGGTVDLIGAAFMLISAVLYALHLIINQRILYEAPAQTVALYTLLSMSVTVSIVFFLFDQSIPTLDVSWTAVLTLSFITFISRVTLFMGIKHLGGLQTAILGLSELLITIFFAHLWLGDKLNSLQWIGAVLLGISVFLVGFDRYVPVKKHTSGLLSWLNPPHIRQTDFPWQGPA
jgi:drug/metabolite transporter (DMT)-like permease